jgi:hypothetical protein
MQRERDTRLIASLNQPTYTALPMHAAVTVCYCRCFNNLKQIYIRIYTWKTILFFHGQLNLRRVFDFGF